LGREWAALALENKRLAKAVDWLWNNKPLLAGSDTPSLTTPAETQAVVKFAVLLSQTWLGRMIVRSRWVQLAGRKLLNRMAKPHAV